MQKLDEVVIRAINVNLGQPENVEQYDASILAERLKKTTTRIIMPAGNPQEFVDFLESGDDVAKFMQGCMSDDLMDILAFHACIGIPGDDSLQITPQLIARQYHGSPYLALLISKTEGLTMTLGQLREAHKMSMAWNHKKLSLYVAEFWQDVRKNKTPIQAYTLLDSRKYKHIVTSAGNSAEQEVSYISSIISSSLSGFAERVTDVINYDPQFELWKKVDAFLNPSRLQTSQTGTHKTRATKLIKVGITAGVDVASGYLQVALKKCQSHRASALALYRNSFRELFAIVGMMDHNFIASFAELIRRPDTVRTIAEHMRQKDAPGMSDVFHTVHEARLARDKEVYDEVNRTGNNDLFIGDFLKFDREYPYNPDFFEVTADGKLIIKQWMIDFIRLMNANSVEGAGGDPMFARGCPMMHGKTSTDKGILFMEDFSELIADTQGKYWQ